MNQSMNAIRQKISAILSEERVTFDMVNELGNKIEISTEPCSFGDVSGIKYTITGPSSTTENSVTMDEARNLVDALSRALRSNA